MKMHYEKVLEVPRFSYYARLIKFHYLKFYHFLIAAT